MDLPSNNEYIEENIIDANLYTNIEVIVNEDFDSISMEFDSITIIDKGKGNEVIDETYECAYPISGHRVVYLNGGKLEYFNSNNLDCYGKALGITLQSGLLNEPISVRIQGKVENIGWGLTEGKIYFSNDIGELITDSSNSLIYNELGYAISQDEFMVNISDSIIQ